jgi:excisionase family DNA binding protein
MAEATLLSLREAAEKLGISLRTLARLIATGEFPSLTIGRRRLIRSAALEAWLEAREMRAV